MLCLPLQQLCSGVFARYFSLEESVGKRRALLTIEEYSVLYLLWYICICFKVINKVGGGSADPLMGENGGEAELKNLAGGEDNMEKGHHCDMSVHNCCQNLTEYLRKTGQTSHEEFDVRVC